MKAIKTLTLTALIAAGSTGALPALAQAMDHGKMHGPAASAPAQEMTEGEIRKVDKENRKLTIKHGEIKNLDMPGMTMVFQVNDAAMLEQVKAGDKIRFKVERKGASLVVTEIQPAGR